MDARVQQLYQAVISYRVAAAVARESLAPDETAAARAKMREAVELLRMHGEPDVVKNLDMERIHGDLVHAWLRNARESGPQPVATASQDGA